ncbi:hypothetical protein IL306_002380 [Fusarium sp. DS 682]|nr:hypothetical protein IL306_002380 [Fusarium sp. DS 682]
MSAHKDRITDTYYPVLLEILKNDPTAFERLDLDCLLCKEKMTFNPEGNFHEDPKESELHKGAYILPCGHIFCFSCTVELTKHHKTNRIPHKCPLCDFSLTHLGCKCMHNEGMPFIPTKKQDENLLAKVKKKVSKAYCVKCQTVALLFGLVRIVLYLHGTSQMIKDGQALGITVKYKNKSYLYWGSRQEEVVRTLPLSEDLLQLYTMAVNSYARNNGVRVPEDGPSPFQFEIDLYKMDSADNAPAQVWMQGLEYVDMMLQTSGNSGYQLAHDVATKLAVAFTTDKAFHEHRKESQRLWHEEARMVQAARATRTRENSEDDELFIHHEVLDDHNLSYFAATGIAFLAGVVFINQMY